MRLSIACAVPSALRGMQLSAAYAVPSALRGMQFSNQFDALLVGAVLHRPLRVEGLSSLSVDERSLLPRRHAKAVG